MKLSDHLIAGIDNALRTLASPERGGRRANPAGDTLPTEVSDKAKRHAAGLMRVNQAGEVAAQGLYQGHALIARDPVLREEMARAADEERDHLNWCTERLSELDARPSVFNPLWYGGAYALGAISGLAGDRWSLGFIAETEKQVVAHLDTHLEKLPEEDARSRQILATMLAEEQDHRDHAKEAGAAALPKPAKAMMKHAARLMTRSAYWI